MQLDPPTAILTAAAFASDAAAPKASSATAASSPASARRGRIAQPAVRDFADIISSQDSLWRRTIYRAAARRYNSHARKSNRVVVLASERDETARPSPD